MPKTSPLIRTRARVDGVIVPSMKRNVSGVLGDQRAELLRQIREHAATLAAKPDIDAIWDDKKWNRALGRAVGGPAAVAAETVATHVAGMLG